MGGPSATAESWRRTAAIAAIVLVGCYIGACIDTWLEFPRGGSALVFPPYAIVTVAMWRSRPRYWPIYMVAGTAGNFLPHHLDGASVTFVLLAELVNHSCALVAAIGVRRLAGRLSTLREMLAFLIITVAVAPGTSALGGATLVTSRDGAAVFLIAWQEWWLSYAITAVTLLPILAFDVRQLAAIPRRRLIEVTAFVVGLVATALVVHAHGMYWALPFLVLAAARLGVAATSFGLLVVTVMSLLGSVEGATVDRMVEHQLFLIEVSIPLLLLAVDIKDRRRAAEERRELETRRSIEEELRDAARRKDEFLATLGHELRGPLTPISPAVEILTVAAPDSAKAIAARDTIHRQVTKMTRLIDDLLDLSRMTLGKIQLQLGVASLRTVVMNALEETREFVHSRGHTLTATLPEPRVRVRVDSIRLSQIVTNLVHNAAKYTNRGGKIDVSAACDDVNVTIIVRDNGIGIEREALERVFELFTQVPAELPQAESGLGIGLSLVKRLVELHGGTVTAMSEGSDRGTEVVVKLPVVVRDVIEPSVGRAAATEPAPVGLRVLAVDDMSDITGTLAIVLGMWGHTVRTANDGSSALEVAATFEPDVVLLDIGLPDINGLEVARRLRGNHTTARLIVTLSGFGQDYVRQRLGDDVPFDHDLVKPIDLARLRVLIDERARSSSHRE